ncbi:hypothetical protein ABZ468_28730 [Streptomyces sp. NPDC005708]
MTSTVPGRLSRVCAGGRTAMDANRSQGLRLVRLDGCVALPVVK